MIELRPYQVEACNKVKAILTRYGFCYLAGEVRTGKTLTALNAVKEMELNTVLFLTKKKAIKSIEKDAEKLGVDVFVTNYEQIKNIPPIHWDCVIADESHCLGTYPKPSQRQKFVDSLSRTFVLCLSGTPSPESFSQLFYQYRLGVWYEYKNFYQWAKDYVVVKKKYVGTGTCVNDYSQAKEKKVLDYITPFVVKMTQKSAGFSTSIEESVVDIKMHKNTYEIALGIINNGVFGYGSSQIVADTGVKQMQKLRQILNGTCITEGGTSIFDSTKVDYIKENYPRKTAIFYNFEAERSMLKDRLQGIWTDSPEEFNETDDRFFIGQVRSSREGVNLSTAEYLVFMGIDYSALSYLQARDRASYLGRTEPPKIHYLFAEGGIEREVYLRVKEKEDYTIRHYESERESISSQIDKEI